MRTHQSRALKNNERVMYITTHFRALHFLLLEVRVYIHNFREPPPSDFDSTMATDDETTKNSPNDWSFVAEEIQSDNGDSSGNYRADTMLCFLKHGTLALTFHANSNGGIVCSKCFQFMKPGSFALHCDKCNKQPAPSAKVVQEWADSDKK